MRVILILLVGLLCTSAVKADPENFMVGPLTFSRPEKWIWKELPQKSHASALLYITDEKTGGESQILISYTPSGRDDVAAKWKSYFVEPPVITQKVTSGKKEKYPMTYITVEGTYRVKKLLKPEHVLAGMIIETKKGNVCGRLIGPKAMVAKLHDPFKKMIEDALKEE